MNDGNYNVKSFIKLTKESLKESEVIDFLRADECGAVALFIGTTRNHHAERTVIHLEYEAYQSMAEKQLQQIGQKMKQRWVGLHKLALIHRLGVVGIGESSVIVGASSAHRRDSLDAVDFGIEMIKASVVIWKKEFYGDDNTDGCWMENKECAWVANS